MAKKSYSFELKNDLFELDKLCENLETFGNRFGFSKKLIFQINLALEELFTNIISYGFKDGKEHIAKVTLAPKNDELCLSIEDDGKPFNPIEFEIPDVSCSVEECKIGGLGIHIIKKLMDEVYYERCGNKNVLILKKKMGQKIPNND